MPEKLTRRNILFATAGLITALSIPALLQAQTVDQRQISPPLVHENLAIYFVRGPSAAGPIPLTLAEGLQRGNFIVHETGDVNSLDVENTGSEPVFIQSGDIVKGGKQDRVLSVSLIVPPKSGRMSIASFCVEQGRWSPRGKEQAGRFEASNSTMPSRTAKLAMKAPAGETTQGRPQTSGLQANLPRGSVSELGTSARQSKVWQEVARKQDQLARAVGAPVASEASKSSLQLTLENEKLAGARAAYAAALRAAGEGDSAIIGYVFAINGKINSGDIYESNGLFRKMWPKMLEASITEALGEKGEGKAEPHPGVEAVAAFLDRAEAGHAQRKAIAGGGELETRTGTEALLFDTRRMAGGLIHRNYLRAN